MDWIITLFVIPEIIVLLIGFVAILASLIGGGELDKLKPLFKPKGKEVAPGYWGRYVLEKDPADTAAGIALPKIIKAPDRTGAWETDWTGGPPV